VNLDIGPFYFVCSIIIAIIATISGGKAKGAMGVLVWWICSLWHWRAQPVGVDGPNQ
jgi:hypothetical protein